MKNSKNRTSCKHSENYLVSEKSCNNQFISKILSTSALKRSILEYKEYLLELLLSLDGVIQSPIYHPESDALFHTLQVFELAYQESNEPELLLAALFHDVGKAVDSKLHSEIGAEMVSVILTERVVWLIKHHLDLMISPRKTKRRLANTLQLRDLVKLRAWDIGGRSPIASVRSPNEALALIINALTE